MKQQESSTVTNKRVPISRQLRFKIFNRDNFTCQYCGLKAPQVVLHIDHVVPVAKGGGNDESNLATACSSCNSGKSDSGLIHISGMPLEDQAKDERWINVRNSILERDNNTCQKCGDTESCLRIHLNWHNPDINLWDHNAYSMTAMCTKCCDSVCNRRDEIINFIHSFESHCRFYDVDILDYIYRFITAIEISGVDDNHIKAVMTMVDLFWDHYDSLDEALKEAE